MDKSLDRDSSLDVANMLNVYLMQIITMVALARHHVQTMWDTYYKKGQEHWEQQNTDTFNIGECINNLLTNTCEWLTLSHCVKYLAHAVVFLKQFSQHNNVPKELHDIDVMASKEMVKIGKTRGEDEIYNEIMSINNSLTYSL